MTREGKSLEGAGRRSVYHFSSLYIARFYVYFVIAMAWTDSYCKSDTFVKMADQEWFLIQAYYILHIIFSEIFIKKCLQ